MQKPFFLSPRHTLSRTTLERIRGRSIRARLKSLGRWIAPLKIVFFIFAFIFLAYLSIAQLKRLFFSTTYFELKNIEVVGLRNLKREQVVKLAGVAPLMNIFNLDRERIKARLLLHPAIKFAAVELHGLYTLKILLTERIPLMYCKWGTSFIEVSGDGIILASETKIFQPLPIITGVDISEKRLGDSLQNQDGFIEAEKWLNYLDSKIISQVSEINFSNLENPYVYLVSGEKIIPRNLEDFKMRFLFLRALLDNLKKNRVEPEYLDLRAPNEIVVKPRSLKTAIEGRIPPLVGG